MKIISYILISAGIWWIVLWLAIFGILQDKLSNTIQVGEYRSTTSIGIATAIIIGGIYIVTGFIIDRKKLDHLEYKKIAGIRRFNFLLIIIGSVWLLIIGATYANPVVWESYNKANISVPSIILPLVTVSSFGVMLIIAAIQQHTKDKKFSEARNIGNK